MGRPRLSKHPEPPYEVALQRFLGQHVANEFIISGQGNIIHVGEVVDVHSQYQLSLDSAPISGLVFSIKYPPHEGLDDEEDLLWDEFVEAWNRLCELRGATAQPADPPAEANLALQTPSQTRPQHKPAQSVSANTGLESSGPNHDTPMRKQARQTRLDSWVQPAAQQAPTKRPRSEAQVEHTDDGMQQGAGLAQANKKLRFQPPAVIVLDDEEEGAAVPEEGSGEELGIAGRLKSIQLRNFMCHPHLECEFGKFVTFISGKNGSGKSAIIQGLQAVLGVSARNTGRGTTLKSYVRTGCPSAEVKVVLHNTGPDRIPRFGDEICIIKKITAAGGGSYKMGNPGDVSKVKKEDVDDVLNALNLDASNPITVITQDKSRTLLADGATDKRKKYDIFMQGSLLGITLDCLKAANKCVAEATDRLNRHVEELTTLQAEIRADQERVQKLKELAHAEEEARLVEDALQWSCYDKFVGDAQNARRGAEKLDMECQRLTSELDVLQQQKRQKEAERDELMEIVRSWQEAAKTAVARQEARKQAVKECKRNKMRLDQTVQQMVQTRDTLSRELDGVQSQLAQDQGAAVAERQQALQAAEVKLLETEMAKATADAAHHDAETQLADMDKLVLEARDTARDLERQVVSAQKQVEHTAYQRDTFAHAATSPAAKFGGQGAARLHQVLLHQSSQFSAPPVGPLGCYLKLKDTHARWTDAVDVVVRGVLNHWLVSRKEDVQVLRTMAVEQGLDPTRMTVCVVSYHVPRHQLPSSELPADRDQFPLVLDALALEGNETTQKLVYNYLLDKTKAARTLMVGHDDLARDVVYEGCVATADSRQQAGAERAAPAGCALRPALLGRNVSQQLNSLSSQYASEQEQLSQLRTKLAVATSVVQALQAQQTHLAARKSQLQAEKRRAHAAYDAARAVLDQLGSQDNPLAYVQSQAALMASNLRELEANLKRLQEDQQAAQQALVDAQQQLAAHQAQDLHQSTEFVNKSEQCDRLVTVELPGLLAQIKKKEHLLQVVIGDRSFQRQQMDDAQASAEDALRMLGLPLEHREQVRQKIWAWLEKKLRHKAELQVARRQGSSSQVQQDTQLVSQELAVLVTQAMKPDALKVRCERMESERLAAQTLLGGTLDEVVYALETKEEKYEKVKARVEGVRASIDLLRAGLTTRAEAYDKCFKATCQKVNYVFKLLLGRRKHKGRIVIDEAEQTLALEVQIKGLDDPSSRWEKDLKQLSGGERSLVTVALLLSISHVSQSPFHCLDEYDVYMDAVNRLVATETLLAHAFEQQAQYILLSPQDLQAVHTAHERMTMRPEMQDRELPPQFMRTQVLKAPRHNA